MGLCYFDGVNGMIRGVLALRRCGGRCRKRCGVGMRICGEAFSRTSIEMLSIPGSIVKGTGVSGESCGVGARSEV